MKNIHTIYCNWDNPKIKIIEKFGITVSPGFNSIIIEESEVYFELSKFFDKWQARDYVVSKFSEEEENNAKRLILLSPWANGYPMPDSDNGYQHTTYNNTEYCNICGMGLRQKEPFRLKKAPNWSGHKRMFSLNWVFDELFVKKDFYESLFKPIGIKSEKVLLYKKETVIEDTVQLIIPETDIALNLEGYSFEVCKNCNRRRYNLINKGFFPPFKEDVGEIQIFKSKESFGTGASARKYIFVSHALRKEFVKLKLNANYIPCES